MDYSKYRLQQLGYISRLQQAVSDSALNSTNTKCQQIHTQKNSALITSTFPTLPSSDFNDHIVHVLRNIMDTLLQIENPQFRRELFGHFHGTAFEIFLLAVVYESACSSYKLNAECRKFLYLASGLSTSSNVVAELIGELLGCKKVNSANQKPTNQAKERYVSSRIMKLYRVLLTESVQTIDMPIVAFFGASITQQKDDVSYVTFFEKAWNSGSPRESPCSIKVERRGYGGMHLGDAGLFCLNEVLELAPNVVILEWHSTGMPKWPDGLLEKIVYTLYCKRILPLILILPKDCDKYYSPPLDQKFSQSMNASNYLDCSVLDLRSRIPRHKLRDLTRDGIHLNPSGAELYGDALSVELSKLFLHNNSATCSDPFFISEDRLFRVYADMDLLSSSFSNVDEVLFPSDILAIAGEPETYCALKIRVGPFSPRVSLTDAHGTSHRSLFDPWCHFERETLRVSFTIGPDGVALITVLAGRPDYSICRKADFSPPDQLLLPLIGFYHITKHSCQDIPKARVIRASQTR